MNQRGLAKDYFFTYYLKKCYFPQYKLHKTLEVGGVNKNRKQEKNTPLPTYSQ